ncbi:MAG: twin-arginine translocation signal domain-containing protein [Nanoarchaeota archaeon]
MIQYNNLENRMGIFRRTEKTIGEKDPQGRRDFLKKVGIGAASLWLGNSFFNTDIAHARKKIPGAIKADPDPSIASAWNIYHNNIYVEYPKHWTAKRRALMILRMWNDNTGWGAIDQLIHKDTPKSSHAYWLLSTKMGASSKNIVKSEILNNHGLKEFGFGLVHLYKKENVWARERFANGIFVSANLEQEDYQRLKNIGIPINYRTDLNQEGNAKMLAKQFVDTNLQNKENILNVGIGEKFKNVNGNFATMDINTPQYALKNVYWNLGFYILAHYMVGKITPYKKYKDEAITLRNKKDTYPNFYNKFKYNTANMDLI